MALAVGERHVLGSCRVHADRIDVELEVGGEAVGEAGPREAAVVRAEDAAFGARAETVACLRPLRHDERWAILGEEQRVGALVVLERLSFRVERQPRS